MSDYEEKWYSLEIDSARRILDLIIKPSFVAPVNFQVHEMQNNCCRLFWRNGFRSSEIDALAIEYYKNNRDRFNEKTPVIELFEDDGFANFMRLNAPIHSVDLSAADMKLVNAVIDANWAPVEFGGGLDGQSYMIKIYGENPREYNRWCDIPASWTALIPLIDFLIDVANLTPRHCYEVTWIDGKHVRPLPKETAVGGLIELPPWIIPVDGKGDF